MPSYPAVTAAALAVGDLIISPRVRYGLDRARLRPFRVTRCDITQSGPDRETLYTVTATPVHDVGHPIEVTVTESRLFVRWADLAPDLPAGTLISFHRTGAGGDLVTLPGQVLADDMLNTVAMHQGWRYAQTRGAQPYRYAVRVHPGAVPVWSAAWSTYVLPVEICDVDTGAVALSAEDPRNVTGEDTTAVVALIGAPSGRRGWVRVDALETS